MKLHFINVIWGTSYLDTFLEFSLPSQFSEGNLPNLTDKISAKYLFYTTTSDKKRIEAAPLFQKLQSLIPVDFRLINIDKKMTDYERMSYCHQEAVKEANPKDAALAFLSPDSIFSTHVFHSLVESLQRGKRLVAICSTRLSLEGMKKALSGRENHSYAALELTEIGLKHLHRRIELSFMQDREIVSHPSQIYWKLDENNLLVKAFHLHPLLVWPEKKDILPKEPIDGPHYLGSACPNLDKWEVITNSQKIAVFELTSNSQFSNMVTRPLTNFRFQLWARKNLTSWSSFFAEHSIILGDGKKKESWNAVKQEANALIHSLLKIKTPYFINVIFLTLDFYIKLIVKILTGKKRVTLQKIKRHLNHIKSNNAFPP